MTNANNSNLALYLLGQHERKEINDAQFLREFGKVRVYHSTPFGDHKDGGSRLFLLPAPNNTAYLPVFTTEERARAFFENAAPSFWVPVPALLNAQKIGSCSKKCVNP